MNLSYPLLERSQREEVLAPSKTPHREGLKDLASFSIDAHFCQHYGAQVFTYSGEITPAYQQLCGAFAGLLDQLGKSLQALKDHIPCPSKDETEEL
jgi:hypothetical protein